MNAKRTITIWDILTILLLTMLIGAGILFFQIFTNPYVAYNPFPPPTLPAQLVLPSATATQLRMPATWTPTPRSGAQLLETSTPGGDETATESTPGEFPTLAFTRTTTPTPTKTLPVKTAAPIGPIKPLVTATKTLTKTPVPTPTNTPIPNIGKVTEKSGAVSGEWQKTNGSPTFVFSVTRDMYAFAWYFGIDPKGVPETWEGIKHDSSRVEFAPPMPENVPCGAFYFRVKVRYALPTKPGSAVKYIESDPKTVFVFQYDNTPPYATYFASSGISGATRGIQNKSGDPKFNLSWVDGVIVKDEDGPKILVAGDYIPVDVNDDGVMEAYKCAGIKGYYVYWGADATGVNNQKFITGSTFDPPAVKSNSAYFLRVKAVDVLSNMSEWRTVALDESYDPLTADEPSPEQAVFYYDTIKPNNLAEITVSNGVISDGPFTNDSAPLFTFSGGNDPVGFRTDVLWGYRIVWSKDSSAPSTFRPYEDGGNQFGPNIGSSGTYYLRVKPVDWAGNTSLDWATFIYKFDNVGPSGVSKVTEAGGAPNNTFQNDKSDLLFTWAAGVTDPGDSKTRSGAIQSYWVYWGADPQPDLGAYIEQAAASYDPPAEPTGIYYLKIMTRDNAGNYTITTPFTLKYDDTPPSPPTKTIDLNGAKDSVPTAKKPKFSWSGASDVGSGINGYFLYFGGDPNGESTKYLTTATYTPTVSSAGTYYLRLNVKDNAGNLSGWTTVFTYIYGP